MAKTVIVTHTDQPTGRLQELAEVFAAEICVVDTEISPPEMAREVAAFESDVAILAPDLEIDAVLELAKIMRSTCPGTECVALGRRGPSFFTKAIRSGLRDVMDHHSDDFDDMVDIIQSLHREAELRKSGPQHVVPQRANQRTIAVLGPKGGVGKSTVAVNTAVGLARRCPNDVVLVDLDTAAGEVANLLQIEPTTDVAQIASMSELDPTAVKLRLETHPSGLLVLPAPASLVAAEGIEQPSLMKLLKLLSNLFKYVVIDTGPGSTESLVTTLQTASEFLIVTTPEISGLRVLQRYMAAFNELGLEDVAQSLILNKTDDKSGVTGTQVGELLSRPVDFFIPTDRQVQLAANQGVAFIDAYRKGPVTSVLDAITRQLTGEPAPNTSKKWFR